MELTTQPNRESVMHHIGIITNAVNPTQLGDGADCNHTEDILEMVELHQIRIWLVWLDSNQRPTA